MSEPSVPPGAPAKRAFDVDKRNWSPSVLPGQIVLVTTVDADGEPNVAPKSWVTMAAFAGPVLAFGCNVGHATYRNALATACFVVNVPDEGLVERIWALIAHRGPERLRRSGFTLAPATSVAAPLVVECRAHLECVFAGVHAFGDEVLVFGAVVGASADAACLEGDVAGRYAALRPVFFLEGGRYAPLGDVRSVGADAGGAMAASKTALASAASPSATQSR